MITARTKKQLAVFVIITLLGVAFVGAKYAKLGSLFYDTSYKVNVHLAESGGIFTGAEVDYRGVNVGQVTDMTLNRDGVTAVISIDNSHDNIPANTMAIVANRSAVGEQYIDLEPKTAGSPYLKDGSVVDTADTRTPVSTTALLTNLDALVRSVPQDKLRTVVSSLGEAFEGTGPALSKIIDTSTSFIRTANDNFDTTTALIRDSNTVLKTQVDETAAIRNFSRDLSMFTDTLAGHDKQLREVIESGSATATELRTFLQQNDVDLGRLISNLLTTGKITYARLPGVRQILVLYPYVVAGSFSVVQLDNPGNPTSPTDPDKKGVYPAPYDVRFGLVLQQAPNVCDSNNNGGYHKNQVRSAGANDGEVYGGKGNGDLKDLPMDMTAGCTDTSGNLAPRGAQMAPRVGANYRAPVASYDVKTGHLTWNTGANHAPVEMSSAQAPELYGKDAWKWMLLQPALLSQG